jgi:hypothetical protein
MAQTNQSAKSSVDNAVRRGERERRQETAKAEDRAQANATARFGGCRV